MVFATAQTTAFFENSMQMGIPHETVVQMRSEGITNVQDLADFDKDALQQLADNLRKPGGRVQDPNPAAVAGATIATPAFVLGAKSQIRLAVACEMVRFYDTVGRPLTPGNMQWNQVGHNFQIQWKAIKDRKKEDDPEVPKITRQLPVIKWIEAFTDFLHRVVGVRDIQLAYVLRTDATVPAAAPALAANHPHSVDHGSVEAELVARATHTHPLFKDDNAKVYYFIEEATRSTTYAASIKPYQRAKDGRGAWTAIKSQYAGQDKWEAEIKRQDELLHNREWKGQSNFTLEHFVSQHRNAFVVMEAAAQHVAFQLPNEHTRVGFLLDAIKSSDAGLQAAIASVRTDTGPTGMRNNFESAVSHVLPYDPVAKKRAVYSSKHLESNISDVHLDSEESSTLVEGPKSGIGSTGVHLRYHRYNEYNRLSDEQKQELREWRDEHPDEVEAQKKASGGKKNEPTTKQRSLTKRQVSSMVTKLVNKKLKNTEQEVDEESKEEKFLMSMVEAAIDKKMSSAQVSSTTTTEVNAVKDSSTSLKAILKKALNDTRK